ncbi:flagellar assembly protein FliH [Acidithiobacillus montserratensis]|uniref:Flagellar assembly protein FliH n=1 Tax=Acidithiobacillus montserratensis TaxID=2729135 RepID=A0ACD5HJF3_9PROT|nr:flagellar assembly protein FliH [Acidithiobacillus montserratensis]MBU2747778.1 flagellar assembly protein FliH [Acidithiobacillus montserratensis]
MRDRADIISGDSAARIERWQLPEVRGTSDKAATQDVVPENGETLSVAAVNLPTTEQLQALYAESEKSGWEQGYRHGQQKGREEGYAEGLARAEAERRALQNILAGFFSPLQALDSSVEQSLLSLSLEIARQVLRHELQLRPEILLPVLREALRAVPLRSVRPDLHMHPDDVEMLQRLMPELVDQGVTLIADAQIERGGAVLSAGLDDNTARPDRRWQDRELDHAATQLDLRLETRWRLVLERLFGEMSA